MLKLETQADRLTRGATLGLGRVVAEFTPPIDEDYWLARVDVGGGQALVAFPKFGTIGIGFAREEDWNTNLPYSCEPAEIYSHIKHNRGKAKATDDECVRAIEMLCSWARSFRAASREETRQ